MVKRSFSWERVLKRNPDFVFRKIAGEVILIPIKRNVQDLDAIYNLNNSVSVRIWELIDGRRTLGEIRELLFREFDVEIDVLEKDIKKFIAELQKIGALI